MWTSSEPWYEKRSPLHLKWSFFSFSVTHSGDIGPGQYVSVKFSFKPVRAGLRKLLVDFDSDRLRDVKGEATIIVREKMLWDCLMYQTYNLVGLWKQVLGTLLIKYKNLTPDFLSFLYTKDNITIYYKLQYYTIIFVYILIFIFYALV